MMTVDLLVLVIINDMQGRWATGDIPDDEDPQSLAIGDTRVIL